MKNFLLFSKVALLVLFFFANANSFAGELDNVYSATVPVNSHDQASREKAIEQAFQRVISRVTMTLPDASSLSENNSPYSLALTSLNAEQFVASYSYATEKGDGENALSLKVQFDGHSLSRSLLSSNIPMVGESRPSLLVLATVSSNDGSNIISEHWGKNYLLAFNDAASRYGVPVTFPTMDLADMQVLTPEVILQSNAGKDDLMPLVSRYHPQGLLVGKVNILSSGEWYADWSLSFGESEYHWSLSAANQVKMSGQIMQKVAQTYRSLFAIKNKNEQVLVLEVVDIERLGQYANMLHYLKKLDMVSAVDTESLNNNSVDMRVSVIGDPQGLIDVLNINKKFQPVDSDVTGTAPTVVYQWRENV